MNKTLYQTPIPTSARTATIIVKELVPGRGCHVEIWYEGNGRITPCATSQYIPLSEIGNFHIHKITGGRLSPPSFFNPGKAREFFSKMTGKTMTIREALQTPEEERGFRIEFPTIIFGDNYVHPDKEIEELEIHEDFSFFHDYFMYCTFPLLDGENGKQSQYLRDMRDRTDEGSMGSVFIPRPDGNAYFQIIKTGIVTRSLDKKDHIFSSNGWMKFEGRDFDVEKYKSEEETPYTPLNNMRFQNARALVQGKKIELITWDKNVMFFLNPYTGDWNQEAIELMEQGYSLPEKVTSVRRKRASH